MMLRDDAQSKEVETHAEGFIRMCAECRRICDEQGSWQRRDRAAADYSMGLISHGLCPECVKKLYPGFSLDKNTG